MVRSILAVLGGYATMVIGVGTTLALLMALLLGDLPEPGEPYDGPLAFLVLELALGGLAAVGGGYVCGLIARRRELSHGLALAGLIVVLGTVSAVMEAGLKPMWSSLLLPVAGAVGVIAGSKLRQRARERAQLREATR